MEKKTRFMAILSVCVFASFFCQGIISTVYGEEVKQKTKIDKKDVYLSLEAICGYEALPYEFLLSEEDYIKTKLDPSDIYVDLETFCSEDIPYKYLVIPGKYTKTKIDYKEQRKIGLEGMLTEDPIDIVIKSKE